MGKATRWLKSILGFKNRVEINEPIKTDQLERKEKVSVLGNDRRWSFTKIGKTEDREHKCLREYMIQLENEQKKHALAVADAVEKAQVAVVGLSGADDGKIKGALFCGGDDESLAALKIQTCFRRHLAKKALRALRSLVKLQAHVRGYLVRKRAAATLHSMQALIRAQATVRSQRISLATTKTNFQSQYLPRRSLEKFNETRSEIHSKRLLNSHKLFNAYEETSNIVEIDTYKPRSRSRRINPSLYDFEYQYPTMSSPLPCPGPAQPDIRNIHHHDYEWAFYRDFGTPAAQYTAQSASRAGPLTPTKSLCEENFFGPSYMADTKSFRAKLRSQSAPKQRPEAQPKKRIPLVEILGARNSTSGVRMQRSCSQLQETFNF